MLCIPKILKNESNSQHRFFIFTWISSCCVSQRYWKMKAIHNMVLVDDDRYAVVVYPKDTEKWKQFTTNKWKYHWWNRLLCIPKILKNESNSQLPKDYNVSEFSCCVSQRYWKMKAIHNIILHGVYSSRVVVYPKDTEKWKQFTTKRKNNLF